MGDDGPDHIDDGSGAGPPASPLDEHFIAGARFTELSAKERAAQAREFQRRARAASRSNRRERRRHLFDKGMRRKVSPWLVLIGVAVAWAALRGSPAVGERISFARMNADRVHVVYVLPVDATVGAQADDEIRHFVTTADAWFVQQTGRHIRIERTHGVINVQRVFVSRTRSSIANHDSFEYIRHQVLDQVSFKSNELPLVFVAAETSRPVCGETLDVAVVWLGDDKCQFGLGLTTGQPGGPPRTAAHEIVHALGGVPTCAPHEGHGHHVTDNPHDIMFSGGSREYPLVLDVNHDDYYDHTPNGCRDIKDANIWTTSG